MCSHPQSSPPRSRPVTLRHRHADGFRIGSANGAEDNGPGDAGLSGFLRSLLSGIPWSESAEAEELFTLARPRGKSIAVLNANGRTQISGEDRKDIEVKVLKQARAESAEAARAMLKAIRVASRDDLGSLELELEIPSKWNRHGSANVELRVPRNLEVVVIAANGRVSLEGMRGRIRARSSNGSVSLSDVIGDLKVFTSNAKICCASTCGRLVARSSNGKIEVGRHSGSLDASTSNGLIRANLERLGREGVVLATSNGRIVLELPEEVDAEVDVRVDNGIIRNSRHLDSETRVATGRIRGRLGKGGTQIKLRTSNGTISLR
jgi:hypothetical protein